MDLTIEEARGIVGNSALWPRMRGFLWDFAPQIHPSWLEGMAGFETAERLMSVARAKGFILESLGVEPCFHAFPKGDWSRLLLVDGSTLDAVAKWLGALVCADALRHVTDGKTVRALKASLSGVYPEVLGFTMYFSGIENLFRGANGDVGANAETVAKIGVSILLGLLSPLPKPLLRRLRLKLNRRLGDVEPLREDDVRHSAAGSMLAKLLKLKFPEAYSLCC